MILQHWSRPTRRELLLMLLLVVVRSDADHFNVRSVER